MSHSKWPHVSVPDVSVAQKIARYTLIGLLILLGAWMLRRFLPALCWAVVLAIGTSSLYDRWLVIFQGKRRHIWAALTFTSIVGIVVIVPLVYGGIVALREAISSTPSGLTPASMCALASCTSRRVTVTTSPVRR